MTAKLTNSSKTLYMNLNVFDMVLFPSSKNVNFPEFSIKNNVKFIKSYIGTYRMSHRVWDEFGGQFGGVICQGVF